MSNKNPIGVFDSGLGGLTVVKELMRQLPYEDIVYFGDTARVPYGTKSKGSVIKFSKENASILMKHKVKMIVVACNTSSSLALSILKRSFPVPIIGVIDSGAKRSVSVTKKKRIGVIATPATIKSGAYEKSIKSTCCSAKIISQACPLFVPLAEEGWIARDITFKIANEYLSKIKKGNVDTLILGCTHYPLLRSIIKKVMGPKVALIDSAEEVAREVKRVLIQKGSISTKKKAQHKFLVSDEPEHFQQMAKRFLGHNIKKVKRAY